MLTSLLKKIKLNTNRFKVEPAKPIVKTNIPGPQSLALIDELDTTTQDSRTIKFFTDFEKSAGNYVADADGNMILDANAQCSSLTVGYNHPDFVDFLKNADISHDIIHRSACALNPPSD